MMVKCTDCKWAVVIEHGYSNYTVEGAYMNCVKDANPNFPTDRFYGKAEKLNINCRKFKKGENTTLDVEYWGNTPENYTDDPKIIRWLRKNCDWS